jgi:putative transposase
MVNHREISRRLSKRSREIRQEIKRLEREQRRRWQRVQAIIEIPRCKYCGSPHVVRYGTFRGVQRWWCKTCQRKFVDNRALPGMKTPKEQIASALNMYYEGMSLNAIRRHLQQMHNNYPSDSTVYDWITKFSKVAVKEAKKHTPEVGDVWVADETMLKIAGKNTWFWDIIDTKTRFLLASHISTRRYAKEAQTLMERAADRADKAPKVVLTDKMGAYLDGIENAFGADTKHIPAKGFKVQPNTNLVERFHGTLKDRTKVMRGLKSIESARLLMDGWLVHYNFFRPHESLHDRTPAEKAGIKFPHKNWLDITKSPAVANISVKPRTMRMPLHTPVVRLSSPTPRITPKTPRISHTPKLRKNELFVGRGMVSRHYFRGAKRRRVL